MTFMGLHQMATLLWTPVLPFTLPRLSSRHELRTPVERRSQSGSNRYPLDNPMGPVPNQWAAAEVFRMPVDQPMFMEVNSGLTNA